MKRKWLAIGIILLFVGVTIAPALAQNTENSQSTSRGNWLYVGGSEHGNYTSIQDAIDNSHDGDTIYVYSGVYNETINIATAIRLLGESKNTTQITAKIIPGDALISLSSCNVTISGFTISGFDSEHSIILKDAYHYPENLRNITISDNIFNGTIACVITLYRCDYCTIIKNTFLTDHAFGIHLLASSYCTIIDNQVISPRKYQFDMYLTDMTHCIISNNSIVSHNTGIILDNTRDARISNNSFYNHTRAIVMEESSDNISILFNSFDNPPQKINPPVESIGVIITDFCSGIQVRNNIIRHWNIGVMIENSFHINISMNTFLKNNIHARFYNKYLSDTIWNQNYWGRPRVFPKLIFGLENTYALFPRMIQFDWHPAQEPYDIPGIR